MKTALIVTLGTRDLTVSRDLLEEKFGPEAVQALYFEGRGRSVFMARPGGEFLLEHFDRIWSQIEFPILAPALDWLYERHDRIDTLILVATDQPEAEDRFKNNDTLHFAELLKRLLPKKYKDKQTQFDIRISLLKKNVAYLDSMYQQLSASLRAKPFTAIWPFDHIYLLNQGGIDAVNTALMLNSLNAYGNRLHLLSVNEALGSCVPLKFPEQYLREGTRAKLQSYLDKYNYAAVKELDVDKNIKALAGYAEHRLNFDFDQAKHSISYLDRRNWTEELVRQIRQMGNDEFELLREVYLNAKIKFEQEAYVDFLFRVFRIVEGLAKFHACKQLDLDFDRHSWKEDIQRCLAKSKNETLRQFLEQYRLDKKGEIKLDLERTPTIPVWIAILEHYDGELAKLLKKIQRLADMRNQSIGAHNFEPVSLRLIEDRLAEEEMTTEIFFSELDKIFEPQNTFEQINRWISQIEKT